MNRLKLIFWSALVLVTMLASYSYADTNSWGRPDDDEILIATYRFNGLGPALGETDATDFGRIVSAGVTSGCASYQHRFLSGTNEMVDCNTGLAGMFGKWWISRVVLTYPGHADVAWSGSRGCDWRIVGDDYTDEVIYPGLDGPFYWPKEQGGSIALGDIVTYWLDAPMDGLLGLQVKHGTHSPNGTDGDCISERLYFDIYGYVIE